MFYEDIWCAQIIFTCHASAKGASEKHLARLGHIYSNAYRFDPQTGRQSKRPPPLHSPPRRSILALPALGEEGYGKPWRGNPLTNFMLSISYTFSPGRRCVHWLESLTLYETSKSYLLNAVACFAFFQLHLFHTSKIVFPGAFVPKDKRSMDELIIFDFRSGIFYL